MKDIQISYRFLSGEEPIADIDVEKVDLFVEKARKKRAFPLLKDAGLVSYQVFHVTLFEMVDNAVSFVMSHIDAHVGVRDKKFLLIQY